MAANPPLICPRCGVEMNHHSDKLIYTRETHNPEYGEGGAIAEFYCCPRCGDSAVRQL